MSAARKSKRRNQHVQKDGITRGTYRTVEGSLLDSAPRVKVSGCDWKSEPQLIRTMASLIERLEIALIAVRRQELSRDRAAANGETSIEAGDGDRFPD